MAVEIAPSELVPGEAPRVTLLDSATPYGDAFPLGIGAAELDRIAAVMNQRGAEGVWPTIYHASADRVAGFFANAAVEPATRDGEAIAKLTVELALFPDALPSAADPTRPQPIPTIVPNIDWDADPVLIIDAVMEEPDAVRREREAAAADAVKAAEGVASGFRPGYRGDVLPLPPNEREVRFDGRSDAVSPRWPDWSTAMSPITFIPAEPGYAVLTPIFSAEAADEAGHSPDTPVAVQRTDVIAWGIPCGTPPNPANSTADLLAGSPSLLVGTPIPVTVDGPCTGEFLLATPIGEVKLPGVKTVAAARPMKAGEPRSAVRDREHASTAALAYWKGLREKAAKEAKEAAAVKAAEEKRLADAKRVLAEARQEAAESTPPTANQEIKGDAVLNAELGDG